MCKEYFNIVKLIQLQPRYNQFLNSYLELDKRNMLQILAFDSKTVTSLLDEKNSHLFEFQSPVIYKV